MLNTIAQVNISKESTIVRALKLTETLNERDREHFLSSFYGYIAGYEAAIKREAGHRQLAQAAAQI